MFLNDQPIENSSQDIIGRKYFAKSLADTLLTYFSTNELVLGLYGEWGSGKTSLINLTVEHLTANAENSTTKPIIIKFNPWNFSEQNHLITQYFSYLSAILKRKDNSNDLIEIGEKLEEYSDFFDPLSIIPVVGQFTFLAKMLMKLSGSSLKKKGSDKKRTLEELRDDLCELLSKLDKKIIVIIDDIDRLTPNEIRQIFQLVKKIADFPNIIYLMSFDKEVVLNALKEIHKGFENKYLEKIVQVPFEIPPLPREKLYNFLTQQIDRILVDFPQNKFDQGYWGNIFNSGIKYYFNSLRDVSRYTNTLSFNYSLVKDLVNPVDFIAITAIQVFHSDLYYSIRSNKDLFAGAKESSSHKLFQNDDKEKEYYNAIIPDNRSIPRERLEELLSRLFPKLESVFGNTFYGADWSGEWRKKVRICSVEFFDVYFMLAFEKTELTPNEVEIILSSADNYAKFREALLQLNEEDRIVKFLEILEDYTSDEEFIPKNNIQNIISTLMDIGDQFPENENKGFYEFDTPMKVLRILYQLSRRYDDHDSRFNLFKNAIENANNSIYTIVHEVGVQDQQHGKYTDEKELPLDRVTVGPEQLEELHELALNKIRLWKSKPEFMKHNHLGAILYRWKEWAGIEEVKDFISNIVSTDDGLVNFIRAFLGRSVSYGMGDYTGKVNWRMDLKDIGEFIDPKSIEPRIRNIYENDLAKYSEKQKIAVETFLDYFDGKKKLND